MLTIEQLIEQQTGIIRTEENTNGKEIFKQISRRV